MVSKGWVAVTAPQAAIPPAMKELGFFRHGSESVFHGLDFQAHPVVVDIVPGAGRNDAVSIVNDQVFSARDMEGQGQSHCVMEWNDIAGAKEVANRENINKSAVEHHIWSRSLKYIINRASCREMSEEIR